jgi:flagellar L-ring protein precursor FlgH
MTTLITCRSVLIGTMISAATCMAGSSIYDLYTAHRAVQVDDILTVLIVEQATAGSQSGTSTSKENDIGATGMGGTGALKFLPNLGVSASNKITYDGTGSTTRQGQVTGKVSARVVRVLDNGNLVVDGSKVLEINNEREVIKIAGTVRPMDIQSDNTVYSYNIADAQITYSGKGTATTGQRPGLIARLFNWIF